MLLASQFSKLSPKTFIQATISSGGSEADCKNFATDTIADTTAVVNDQQGELNAVDTGAGCATEGDFVVTAAQIALAKFKAGEATAQTAHTNAASAQATACSAPVSFAVNLDTLESSECFSYQSQGDYDSVKSVCTIDTQTTATAVSTLNTAKTAVADATSALADAETESARLTSECNCRVQTEQAKAWTAASAATAAHAADWKQAHEVLCALDQTTTCTVPTCPAVTQPTLAAGVADEVCSAKPSTDDGYQFETCVQDCSTTSSGIAGNRVCDDVQTNVQDPRACPVHCKSLNYNKFMLACPTAGKIECWCCNTLDLANDGREHEKLAQSECTGGEMTSGINSDDNGHCSGTPTGTFIQHGYFLGGYCRGALYNIN